MKRMQRILRVPLLVVALTPGPGYSAEPVAPRFPDTELPSPAQEGDVMSRQGQVYVSGILLVSPCVLSDWATEIQGQSWMRRDVRQVTLALEGCGDGTVNVGRQQNAPMSVRGHWGGGGTASFPLRLHDGMNWLTLPVPAGGSLMPLEMTYE